MTIFWILVGTAFIPLALIILIIFLLSRSKRGGRVSVSTTQDGDNTPRPALIERAKTNWQGAVAITVVVVSVLIYLISGVETLVRILPWILILVLLGVGTYRLTKKEGGAILIASAAVLLILSATPIGSNLYIFTERSTGMMANALSNEPPATRAPVRDWSIPICHDIGERMYWGAGEGTRFKLQTRYGNGPWVDHVPGTDVEATCYRFKSITGNTEVVAYQITEY